jgi:hypothetical protein
MLLLCSLSNLLLVSSAVMNFVAHSSFVLGYYTDTTDYRDGVSTWHAKHILTPQKEALLLSKLHRQSHLGSCPNEMSCERTDIDRCCSPVMGLVVFVQQVR